MLKKFLVCLLLISTVFNKNMYCNQKSEYSVGSINQVVGLGRLAKTISEARGINCQVVSIETYEEDKSKYLIRLDAGNHWTNGYWLVWLGDKSEVPKNGYWFILYDQYYHNLGTCIAKQLNHLNS